MSTSADIIATIRAAIEPDAIKSAIDHASEAGVKLVCFSCVTTDGGKVTVVTPDESKAGELIAKWAIVHTEGKASALRSG